ncbi:MAG: helix-turn-helix domain-containing protein [Sandaracinaceae bacterium]|nr:helix-turn-helix domain-containing protein [Sandaracinaceae bacterium]
MLKRPDANQPLLSEQQTARALGVARSTLARWRRMGAAPPHLRLGRLVRYRPCDVRTYLATRAVSR